MLSPGFMSLTIPHFLFVCHIASHLVCHVASHCVYFLLSCGHFFAGNILMLSEGHPGIDDKYFLKDGMNPSLGDLMIIFPRTLLNVSMIRSATS